MKNIIPGAMLPGARELLFERKEDALGFPEIKAAVDLLGANVTAFRAKNDQLEADAKALKADAVTKAELKTLSDAVDEAKTALTTKLEEFEAKANRQLLTATVEGAAEAKNAAEFGKLIGKDGYTADEFKQYRTDLDSYLRNAQVKAATMSVAVDPSGGFWVTPDITGRMVKKIYETTPMRQLASVVQIGTDRLEGPIDNGEAEAGWVGELDLRPQTGMPQLGMWAIDVNELYAFPWVTQKLLEDASIDVEAWIADKATSKFSRVENAAFLKGDGVKKPKGLLVYPTSTAADDTRPWGTFQVVGTGTAGGFGTGTNGSDKLIDLVYEVKAPYRQNGKFLAARRTLRDVRKLKDGQGNYAIGYTLRDGVLVEAIYGFGVADGEDMPAIAANSNSIAFGDFAEAYTIVDRVGVSTVRDNITRPGFVKFHMRKRVGGGAVNTEAVKFLTFA